MTSQTPSSYGILTKHELERALDAVEGLSSWEASAKVFKENDHLSEDTPIWAGPSTNWKALTGLIETIHQAVPVSDDPEDALVYLATICAHAQIAMNVLALRRGFNLDHLVRVACGAILEEIPKPGHAVIKSAITGLTKRHPYENIEDDSNDHSTV